MVGFYAADSGIEKVLYYDSNVLPTYSDGTTMAARGLCSMYLPPNSTYNNPNYCSEDQDIYK